MVKMEEAGMIAELKKRGYRISKPKPKVEEEFKPFKAIRIEPYGRPPREVEVIRESRKRVWVKTDYGEREAKKDGIYKHDPEALKIWAEAEDRADELTDQAKKLGEQANKIEYEASDKIKKMLKPVYPKGGE
ncbi:hypothetical protein ES706_03747 [subsurface metagenome]